MTERAPRLTPYYLYQLTASCVFFAPVFYVYYQERVGLTLATVLWIQSYYVAMRALLEVPLGALADRYSRRACLAAYGLGHVAGAAILLLAPTFAGVLVAETIFAAANAFRSGADSALLFDTLANAGRIDLYPRAEGRAQAVISLGTGATAVVGGLLAAVDLRLPYVVTAVAAGVSAACTGVLAEPARPRTGSHASVATLMRDAGRETARSPAVRWVMALAAFTVVMSHAYYYLQQPYLAAVGVPLALFGVVFAGVKAVTAAVAYVAHRVDVRLGARAATGVMTLVPLVGLAAMSRGVEPASALWLLTRGVLDGLWQPLMNVYMNRLVDSRLRATMLSAQSFVARLTLAGAIALLGASVARVGLAATLAAAALVAALAGGVLVAICPRLPREGRVIAEDA